MNATALVIPPESFIKRSPKTRPMASTCYSQLLATSRSIFHDLMNAELRPVERAALARALCDVDKRIRAWKGLPEPGQLRPDSLPGKRARKGKLIELAAAPTETPDAPASVAKVATTTPTTEARADETTKPADPEQVTTPKEST